MAGALARATGRAALGVDGERPPQRVAVVIVSFNSEDVLPGCLAALERAAEGVKVVSVVLADNASRDSSIAVAEAAWPGITVIQTGANLGYAAALNRGREACKPYDALLVLNPDTVLEPGAVRVLARSATRPGRGIAVPRMVQPDGTLALSLRRNPSLRSAWAEALLGGPRAGRLGLGEVVADAASYRAEREVDWATGAAVMIAQNCWAAIGEWDESFFLYSEETEYMLRAQRAGFRVTYVPQAVCRHRGGESSTSPFLWSLLMVNKLRLYRRSHGPVPTAAFRLALLAGQAGRALLGSKRGVAAVRGLVRSIEAP